MLREWAQTFAWVASFVAGLVTAAGVALGGFAVVDVWISPQHPVVALVVAGVWAVFVIAAAVATIVTIADRIP